MNQIQKTIIFMVTFLAQGAVLNAMHEDVYDSAATVGGKMGDAVRGAAFWAREKLGLVSRTEKAKYYAEVAARKAGDALGTSSPSDRFNVRVDDHATRAQAAIETTRTALGFVGDAALDAAEQVLKFTGKARDVVGKLGSNQEAVQKAEQKNLIDKLGKVFKDNIDTQNDLKEYIRLYGTPENLKPLNYVLDNLQSDQKVDFIKDIQKTQLDDFKNLINKYELAIKVDEWQRLDSDSEASDVSPITVSAGSSSDNE